jgi:hypothetical protein
MRSRGVCCLSVSRARFATAGAIDPKVVHTKSMYHQVSVTHGPNFGRPILGLATRVQKLKIQSTPTPELMAGSSPNFWARVIKDT